jgi:hypothetical protein
VEGSCEYDNRTWATLNFGISLSSCKTGSFSRRAQLHGISWFNAVCIMVIPLVLL